MTDLGPPSTHNDASSQDSKSSMHRGRAWLGKHFSSKSKARSERSNVPPPADLQSPTYSPQTAPQPSPTPQTTAIEAPEQLSGEPSRSKADQRGPRPLSNPALSLEYAELPSGQSSIVSSVNGSSAVVNHSGDRTRKIIPTILRVILGQDTLVYPYVISTRWQRTKEFERLGDLAQSFLEHRKPPLYNKNDLSTKLYLQFGSARILKKSDGSELQSCFLDNNKDWRNHLQRIIQRTLSEEVLVDFELEIRWNFVVLNIHRNPGESLAYAIRTAFHDQLISNFDSTKFIPRKAIDTILDESAVNELINEDDSFSDDLLTHGGRHWGRRADFAQHVFAFCIPILALFVYTKMSMKCLYFFVDKIGIGDKKRPLTDRPLREDDCPDHVSKADFEDLLHVQSKFYAYTFHFDRNNRRRTHDNLDDDNTLPILRDGSPERSRLGRGSYGNVYRVRLHPEHHNFDSERNKHYALKIFNNRVEDPEELRQEELALQKLSAVPHPNLVLHLAAMDATPSALHALRMRRKKSAQPACPTCSGAPRQLRSEHTGADA